MPMHNPPHPGEFVREVYLEPNGLSRRAAVILHAGEGMPNKTIAKRLGITETTVRKWCKRFIDEG